MTKSSVGGSSKIAKFILKIAIAFIVLAVVFHFYNYELILEQLKGTSLHLYAVVVAGHFFIMGIKSLRWKILLKEFGIHCKYIHALKAYVAAFSFGTFTPGQIGDMTKVMLIDSAKGKRKLALVPSLLDRLWDLIGLILASIICAGIIFNVDLKNFISLFIISILFLLLVSFPVFSSTRRFLLAKKNLDISLAFRKLSSSILLTGAVVIVQFLRWIILAKALSLPAVLSASSATIGTFIALIPVSFGGLGTREASMAWMFKYSGLPAEAGISFSLLMFGAYLIGALVGVIVLSFFDKSVLSLTRSGDKGE